jgi:transcriptional regulator with XRE-family HTH domain
MKVTPEVITKIQRGLTRKGMNQAKLAEKLGWHRASVSKLLKGKTDTLSDESIDIINDVLTVDLQPIAFPEGKVSSTVLKLSRMAASDQKLAELLEIIADLDRPSMVAFLPQVDTKRLPKVGAKITQIVMQWEDGADPHYSKIAVEVLDFLREYYTKEDKP